MNAYLKAKWLITQLVKRYKSHSLSTTSAYMAYYWVLAFFPFIIFIISLLMHIATMIINIIATSIISSFFLRRF